MTKSLRSAAGLCIVGVTLLCTISQVFPQSISVPLKVSEALIASASGINRTSEPVTVGIPFPDDANIASIDQLGITGRSVYQFRQLDKWPSGNLKWVLVDFLADVSPRSASTYMLTAGTGTDGGPNLATGGASSIWVDTGVMRVEILKNKFNLFNQVLLGDQVIVSANTSDGVVLRGADGVIYSSKNDPAPRVVIEENGPVRAVIKSEGGHYSSQKLKLFDYTIRMHFYKGKSRVRLFYTLRNANRDQVANAGIQYLDLQIKTSITNGQFQFPTHNSAVTGQVMGNDSSSIFQAYATYPQVIDWNFVPPIPRTGEQYQQEGYVISKNLSLITSAGKDSYPELLYCKLSSAQAAAVAGVRFGAGWWPKSLQAFGDGKLSVGLWPKFNSAATYIRFGSHNTFEILFEFSANPQLDAAAAMRRFQYPLVASAPVLWYNSSHALYEKIVTFADERKYYQARGWPAAQRRPDGWPVDGLKIYRCKYWGEGGGGNQYDFTRINLVNFLREDANFRGEYYLMAEQRLHYNADWATYHSDNFDPGLQDVPELISQFGDYLGWPDLNSNKVSTSKVIFELEHRHWYGMALFYYMTGDERFKDAILDWGEYLIAEAKSDQNKWVRALSWNIFGLTELFRFTKQQKYLNMAKDLLHKEIYNPVAVPGQTAGFDRTRGYFVDRTSVENKSRVIAIFMQSAILFRALQLLYDELPVDDPAHTHVGDVLTGIAWFTYHELWFQYGTTAGQFGYPYLYNLDNKPPADVRTESTWWGGMREIFEVTARGYELTGDSRFLTRVNQTLMNAAYNTNGTYWYQDYPGLQQMLYLMRNQQTAPLWRPLEIKATRNGDGSYTLTWVVPSGARQIQIKYSTKQLVEWLNFDRDKRTYGFAPQTHEAYFAAATLTGLPPLGKAGAQQSMKVTSLDPSKVYNFLAKAYVDKASITGVDQKSGNALPPMNFRVLPNYPNPFNPETTIPIELSRQGEVNAKIYDASGNEVTTLLRQPLAAGSHLLKWRGRDRAGHEVASGVYFLKVQAEAEVATRKMLLLR